MPDTKNLDKKLNDLILRGQVISALEEFYADDVQMQENSDPPRMGKPACRDAKKEFLDTVETFHATRLLGTAVEGELSFSEWEYDVTFKNVRRILLSQVAVRRWRDGKVVNERFYHKPN